jgi:hypothetical protein
MSLHGAGVNYQLYNVNINILHIHALQHTIVSPQIVNKDLFIHVTLNLCQYNAVMGNMVHNHFLVTVTYT